MKRHHSSNTSAESAMTLVLAYETFMGLGRAQAKPARSALMSRPVWRWRGVGPEMNAEAGLRKSRSLRRPSTSTPSSP